MNTLKFAQNHPKFQEISDTEGNITPHPPTPVGCAEPLVDYPLDLRKYDETFDDSGFYRD